MPEITKEDLERLILFHELKTRRLLPSPLLDKEIQKLEQKIQDLSAAE